MLTRTRPKIAHTPLWFILTVLLLSIAVGLRPSFVGTDTVHYIERFQYFVDYHFNVVGYEWLVGGIAVFSTGFTESPRLFFTLLAGIDCILMGVLAKKL